MFFCFVRILNFAGLELDFTWNLSGPGLGVRANGLKGRCCPAASGLEQKSLTSIKGFKRRVKCLQCHIQSRHHTEQYEQPHTHHMLETHPTNILSLMQWENGIFL